jgi:energy-coupling factor transport system substrate-specific component
MIDLDSIVEWSASPGGIAIWLTVLLGLIFGSMLLSADRSMKLGREAALLALLAAVASAARVLFAALPNVQPVTILILLIGIHLGPRRATAVAVLVALLSNMALGHGPWTFYQAVAWALVGISGWMLRPWLVSRDGMTVRVLPLAILGFIWGFLYDWLVSITMLAITQQVESYVSYFMLGLPFDLMHAVGNVLFAIWLAPSLHRLLWLHCRHDAGGWVDDLPEDVLRREAFISGGSDATSGERKSSADPMAGIRRFDTIDEGGD